MEWKYQLGHILNEDEIDDVNKVNKTILELLEKCDKSNDICPSFGKNITYNNKIYRIRATKAPDNNF